MSMSAPAITSRAFWSCSASFVGPLEVSPNHSMFQLAISSVVSVPLPGTTCMNDASPKRNESKSRESVIVQIDSVLLMHIPFVVEGGTASDRVVSWSVCRIARQSRQLSGVNIDKSGHARSVQCRARKQAVDRLISCLLTRAVLYQRPDVACFDLVRLIIDYNKYLSIVTEWV